MTTVETAKRRAWAAIHFGDCNLTDTELDNSTYKPSENFSDGWDKGAEYALQSQWKDPKVELPEIRKRVLVCARCADGYRVRIEKRIPYNDSWEWNQSTRECVVAWMPLPEFNPGKLER